MTLRYRKLEKSTRKNVAGVRKLKWGSRRRRESLARNLLHTALRVRRDVFVNRSEKSEEREFTLWERRRAQSR